MKKKMFLRLSLAVAAMILSMFLLVEALWAWFVVKSPKITDMSWNITDKMEGNFYIDNKPVSGSIILSEAYPGYEYLVTAELQTYSDKNQYLKVLIANPHGEVIKQGAKIGDMNDIMGIAYEKRDSVTGELIIDPETNEPEKIYKRFSELLEEQNQLTVQENKRIVEFMVNFFVPAKTSPTTIQFWLVFFIEPPPGVNINIYQKQQFKIDKIQITLYPAD